MASNYCDKVNYCKNSWWCATDYNPTNKEDCFEPQTNYDRIISKTPEELAILFEDGCPPGDPICNSTEMIEGETTTEHCQRCWLAWLKSPAEEGK